MYHLAIEKERLAVMELPRETMAQFISDDFDGKKAYVPAEKDGQASVRLRCWTLPRGETDLCSQFDDGREIELLHFIHRHRKIAELRGNPSKVLKAIDEYARTKKFLMNVGEDKGKIVTDLIADVRPETMVELGGYVGYSAILFGDAVRRAGGRRYFSLERNPEFAAVIMSLVDLAGLSDVVKVVVGRSGDSLERLHKDDTLQQIDLLFLDHYKPAYTIDLKLCEQLGLLKPGSVLAADNVIKPENPPYLEYVQSTVAQKRERYEKGKVNGAETEFAKGTTNQYEKREREEEVNAEIKGNPDLIYESKMFHSFEPTGIPVSLLETLQRDRH